MRWRSCDVSDVGTHNGDGENERIELIVLRESSQVKYNGERDEDGNRMRT